VEELSLRERKKQETRDLLVQVAWTLFTRHGFDQITVDDIAAGAEVSPRTFFRYFGSKEAVLFGDQELMLDEVREAIAARPADEPALVAVREALLSLAHHFMAHRSVHLARARLARDAPAIAAYQGTVLQPAWEDALAAGLAEHLGVVVDQDVRPRLLAGTAIAAMTAASGVWLAADGDVDPIELLRAAFAELTSAVGAAATDQDQS
jgi:AcrR family transcriptional regulator